MKNTLFALFFILLSIVSKAQFPINTPITLEDVPSACVNDFNITLNYLFVHSDLNGYPDSVASGIATVSTNGAQTYQKREDILPFGLFHAVNNEEKQFLYHQIDPSPGGGSDVGGVLYLLDSAFVAIDTFDMGVIPIQYLFKGVAQTAVIELDNHDARVIEVNGNQYYLVIGSRNEWQEGSLWGLDSILVRLTTLHLFDVITHQEISRFDPLSDGIGREYFKLDWAHLSPNYNAYSFPHFNVLDYDPTIKRVYASGRFLGIAAFDLDANLNFDPVWVVGEAPKSPNPLHLVNIGGIPNGNHGSSTIVKNGKTYVSTYSNNTFNGEPAAVHVYEVDGDTARLFWSHVSNTSFFSTSTGYSVWTSDYTLLFCHGKGYMQNGAKMPPPTEVWNPFTNTQLLSLGAPADAGFSEEVKSTPRWAPISFVQTNNELVFSYPERTVTHWEIGKNRIHDQQLILPIAYLDSLDLISVWFETSEWSGLWGVTEKNQLFPFDNFLSGKLNITPTLVSTIVTITNLSSNTRIRLTSITGETLQAVQNDDNAHMELDMSSYQTGIYFITIQTGNEMVTRKVAKL